MLTGKGAPEKRQQQQHSQEKVVKVTTYIIGQK